MQMKEIAGFPGYKVSDDGKVWSDIPWRGEQGRWLKGQPNNDGYMKVWLYVDGKRYRKSIHRIVAQAFIPNPDNLPEVNHKDEDKVNNRVEDLEWGTRKYNNNYGTRNERANHKIKATKQRIYGKPVLQLTLDGKEVARYCCAREAERQTGFANGSIGQVCRGERKTCGGYIWQYLPKE